MAGTIAASAGVVNIPRVKQFEARRAVHESLHHGAAAVVHRSRVLDPVPKRHRELLRDAALRARATDDPQDWATVVDSMSRLVFKISAMYWHKWHTHMAAQSSFDDVFNAGLHGLVIGVRKYDPASQHALTTYATHWIRTHVQRTIYQMCGSARIPEHLLQQGMDPTSPLIASAAMSLEWRADDEGRTIHDYVSEGADVHEQLVGSDALSDVLEILSSIDAQLPEIAGLLVDGLGDGKIAQATGLTVMRVGELRLAAQAALRQRGFG